MTELEELYNSYFRDVYLFVYGLSKDKHVAEDITSETFLKALAAIDRFEGNCDIRVWLCQIAKNSYYSFLRKNKQTVAIDTIPHIKNKMDVEKLIFRSDQAMRLHQVLHHIPEPYKEVFTLRIFGELSFKQIATVFGKSDNWACVTYHRARKKIRDEMGDDF